jgi:hypothetical protein
VGLFVVVPASGEAVGYLVLALRAFWFKVCHCVEKVYRLHFSLTPVFVGILASRLFIGKNL